MVCTDVVQILINTPQQDGIAAGRQAEECWGSGIDVLEHNYLASAADVACSSDLAPAEF